MAFPLPAAVVTAANFLPSRYCRLDGCKFAAAAKLPSRRQQNWNKQRQPNSLPRQTTLSWKLLLLPLYVITWWPGASWQFAWLRTCSVGHYRAIESNWVSFRLMSTDTTLLTLSLLLSSFFFKRRNFQSLFCRWPCFSEQFVTCPSKAKMLRTPALCRLIRLQKQTWYRQRKLSSTRDTVYV